MKPAISNFTIILASVILGFVPSVIAAPTNTSSQAQSPDRNSIPMQLAQGLSCPDSADGAPAIAFFETQNFWIYICELDGWYYHGISKADRQSITLPTYDAEDGTGFVASNGEYAYAVNSTSLRIYRNGILIQEEAVY